MVARLLWEQDVAGSNPVIPTIMKIIRTFSSLESRSDYLVYSSIPILIARNEQLQQYVFKNNLKLIFFQLARYRQLKSSIV